MMRIKATLSKNIYKEILNDVDKANRDIRDITHQNVYLEPIRKKRQSKRPIAELKLIRKHAASLYHVFVAGKCWKCECQNHVASLRLEPRPQTLDGGITSISPPPFRFRIILSSSNDGEASPNTESHWQEIEIAPSFDSTVSDIVNNVPQATARTVRFIAPSNSGSQMIPSSHTLIHQDCGAIVDICSTLCASQDVKKAIGFLVDGEDKDHKHYVYRADTGIRSDPQSRSLGEMLGSAQQQPAVPMLSRGDRLQIAVTLASSVLQLDGTSWLESEWTSKDIYFHTKDKKASNENYSNPYLSWKSCTPNSKAPSSVQSAKLEHLMDRCQILFALGLTLVELCFGRTLLAMQTPEDHDAIQEVTKFRTARRLLNSVYSEMGTSYGDVVRRCLFQPFDVRAMSLENEVLQQKVFDDVVMPLIEDLNNFNGKLRIS